MRVTIVIEDIADSVKVESYTNPPHKTLAPEQLEASPAFGLFCVIGNIIGDQLNGATITQAMNTPTKVEEIK